MEVGLILHHEAIAKFVESIPTGKFGIIGPQGPSGGDLISGVFATEAEAQQWWLDNSVELAINPITTIGCAGFGPAPAGPQTYYRRLDGRIRNITRDDRLAEALWPENCDLAVRIAASANKKAEWVLKWALILSILAGVVLVILAGLLLDWISGTKL